MSAKLLLFVDFRNHVSYKIRSTETSAYATILLQAPAVTIPQFHCFGFMVGKEYISLDLSFSYDTWSTWKHDYILGRQNEERNSILNYAKTSKRSQI